VQPVVVIGDRLTCAGFRLAGVEVHSPAPAELQAVFERALDSAQMVVLTRTAATAIEPAALRRAQAREKPLLVVLNDVRDPDAQSDYARRVRAVLGIGN
jgi:vacuolar-type H+-ATPase subunit F/Vma7